MQEEKHVTMTKGSVEMPPWVIGVALLTGGGLSGAGIHASTSDSPAVLEQRMDDLGSKITESREAAQKSNDEMKVTITELQKSVTQAGFDRFTRSNHEVWVAKSHKPLEERLNLHIVKEGHAVGMRAIDRHEASIENLKIAVRDLQSFTNQEARPTQGRR